MERIQSGLDGVARGIDYLGRKAEDLVGPGLGFGEDPPTAFNETRQFAERYPMGPNGLVSVSSEFGGIRVETWNERVVLINAEIRADAETPDVAAEIVRAIDVNVQQGQNALEIRTILPDRRRDLGYVAMQVDYTITVPADANVVTDNFMGDTVIRGVQGLVAVESQYGLVDLADLSGEVKVRTHGEFPLLAQRLANGGTFELNGARAEFVQVAGALHVNNFRGAVALREIRPEAQVSVVSDSGPIYLVLPPEAEPDLSATVLYGKIASDLRLNRSAQGNLAVARSPNLESAQHINLNASFSDIHIERPAKEGEPLMSPAESTKPFNDLVNLTERAVAGTSLFIDASIGDVRVEPAEGDFVQVTATRIVWVETPATAPAALEALQVQIQRDTERVTVTSVVTTDMNALGCSSYRADLLVKCPADTPIEIHGQDGLTSVTDLRAPIIINQNAGAIAVEDAQGNLNLKNSKGDIKVLRCVGDVEASGRFGTVTLSSILGAINAHNVQGRIIIESPLGPLTVRNSGGDVRILALDGIAGDFDAEVESGTLSLLLPSYADATLTAIAEEGRVESAIPLTGTINGSRQEFHGQLSSGRHKLSLRAKNGSIVID
jgi:hypothetical protein